MADAQPAGPPPVSSLFLPAGRGLDWSFAGYKGKWTTGTVNFHLFIVPYNFCIALVHESTLRGLRMHWLRGTSPASRSDCPPASCCQQAPADGDAALPAPTPTPEYNVLTQFGAVGDGVNDDTAALQVPPGLLPSCLRAGPCSAPPLHALCLRCNRRSAGFGCHSVAGRARGSQQQPRSRVPAGGHVPHHCPTGHHGQQRDAAGRGGERVPGPPFTALLPTLSTSAGRLRPSACGRPRRCSPAVSPSTLRCGHRLLPACTPPPPAPCCCPHHVFTTGGPHHHPHPQLAGRPVWHHMGGRRGRCGTKGK